MAQRDKKEETELQVSETLTLCVNNCGFYGNPATNNMCQSCFQSSVSSSSSAAAAAAGPPSPVVISSQKLRSAPDRPVITAEKEAVKSAAAAPAPAPPSRANRCYSCRKRVGLTGFRCRCGELFCGEHRYSDRHVCSFDYKAAGREAIARENPVVRAAKIVRV